MDLSSERLSLYGGAGFGIANVEFEGRIPSIGISFSFDAAAFAYQFLAGVGYRLDQRLTLVGGYRLWRTGDFELGSSTLEPATVHAAELGVRVDF